MRLIYSGQNSVRFVCSRDDSIKKAIGKEIKLQAVASIMLRICSCCPSIMHAGNTYSASRRENASHSQGSITYSTLHEEKKKSFVQIEKASTKRGFFFSFFVVVVLYLKYLKKKKIKIQIERAKMYLARIWTFSLHRIYRL